MYFLFNICMCVCVYVIVQFYFILTSKSCFQSFVQGCIIMERFFISPYRKTSSPYWVNHTQHYTIQQQWEPSFQDLLTHFTHVNESNIVEFTRAEELNLQDVIYNFQEKLVMCMQTSTSRIMIEPPTIHEHVLGLAKIMLVSMGRSISMGQESNSGKIDQEMQDELIQELLRELEDQTIEELLIN